ncbi:CubicO group peptidase (beta-lactamase class C family) [Bradyrhizobium sp. LM3.6]
MQRYVDQEIIPGASWAVLRGREVVDQQCVGFADREASTALRPDHIFRAFSNTKIFVTCAVMLLVEEGRIGLDDVVEKFLPQLGNRKVLKPGASSLADVEPAKSPITVRQLLTHTAGLSYGIFDPGSVLFKGYNEAIILNPLTPLTGMIDQLADLPLSYHPGSSWEYSVATDVLGRVVEVVSGKPLDAVFKACIFEPLGMTDTGFHVPDGQQGRLVALYNGADVLDPMKPGLTRADNLPYPQAYRRQFPRMSGGRRAGLDLARHARFGTGAATRPGCAAEAGDAAADDDEPVARRPDHPLRQSRPDPRQGLWPRWRRHFRADAVRSPEFHRRIPVGRPCRHPLVDLPAGQYRRRTDDAALHGFLESILLRIQASGLSVRRTLSAKKIARCRESFWVVAPSLDGRGILLRLISEDVMAFCRKNIGGLHQAVRIALGVAVAVAAFAYFSGAAAWLVALGGAGFALTGLVGYCPMCAMAGIGRGGVS